MRNQFLPITCWLVAPIARLAAGSVARILATGTFCLASFIGAQAQGTNSPARLEYQAFKIIAERNIFDPNRSSRSGSRSDARKPVRVESFALVGTFSYEKGNFAVFDGSDSAYRKVLKVGEAIAGYKITDISGERVKLDGSDRPIELAVGTQLKRQDGSAWELAGRAESFGPSAPATASNDKSEVGSAAENDVLKKLLQKREEELK